MSKKKEKLRGVVKKMIKSIPERAQIDIHEADDLYREIRIENVGTDENGKDAKLKEGSEVDVILEADSDATTQKTD